MSLTYRAAALVLVAFLALPLAGCGWGGYDDPDGNVFVANRTNETTPEQALAFRLATFGDPFSGNYLGTPLDAGASRFIGEFHADHYDAEADMAGGDLVEWFDRWVGYDRDTYFDIF
jgi:hypothetical protein